MHPSLQRVSDVSAHNVFSPWAEPSIRVNCCLLSVVIAKCYRLQLFQCLNEMPCATLLLFSNQYITYLLRSLVSTVCMF